MGNMGKQKTGKFNMILTETKNWKENLKHYIMLIQQINKICPGLQETHSSVIKTKYPDKSVYKAEIYSNDVPEVEDTMQTLTF